MKLFLLSMDNTVFQVCIYILPLCFEPPDIIKKGIPHKVAIAELGYPPEHICIIPPIGQEIRVGGHINGIRIKRFAPHFYIYSLIIPDLHSDPCHGPTSLGGNKVKELLEHISFQFLKQQQ